MPHMDATTLQELNVPGFLRGDHIVPACRPFFLDHGNREAVLMIHGFTGSPADFRIYAKIYARSGYDVAVPLLPGHGSHISYLERLTFRELYIPLEPVYDFLQKRYQKVHVLGLSYGAVLSTKLALARKPPTLTLFAPAFYLSVEREKRMRWIKFLRLHRLFNRLMKPKFPSAEPTIPVMPHDYTYRHVALQPVVSLHDEAALLRKQLPALDMPVYHAHGDRDGTTPIHSNKVALSQVIRNYSFYRVEGGIHVLPIDDRRQELAADHLQWLEGQRH
jgi:carboxylesterase